MDFKIRAPGVIACCLLSGWSLQAGAADVLAKVAIGQKSMDLTIRDRQFTPSFTTLDLSVTGAFNNFYITLDHDASIKDAIEKDPNGLIFYSRADTNLTLGYSWLDSLSVFAGYRTGKTSSFYSGTNDNFDSSSQGPYFGASTSFRYADKGSLSVSLAIASLTGKVSLSEPLVDTSRYTLAPPPDYIEGDAVGYSFGLDWTGAVSESTSYNIGLRIHRYEFEDQTTAGGPDLSYDENFSTFSVGLSHYF